MSTVLLSTNAFGRQFHWDMVLGKNEYLCKMCVYVCVKFWHVAKSVCMFASSSGMLQNVCLCERTNIEYVNSNV